VSLVCGPEGYHDVKEPFDSRWAAFYPRSDPPRLSRLALYFGVDDMKVSGHRNTNGTTAAAAAAPLPVLKLVV
jgi:hypothetical protein